MAALHFLSDRATMRKVLASKYWILSADVKGNCVRLVERGKVGKRAGESVKMGCSAEEGMGGIRAVGGVLSGHAVSF